MWEYVRFTQHTQVFGKLWINWILMSSLLLWTYILFFKIFTSRKEDIMEISSLFEDETDLFFLRPVDTCWLSTQPVLERIVNKWKTITEYFCTFVKNSSHQNEKNARNCMIQENSLIFETFSEFYHLFKHMLGYSSC